MTPLISPSAIFSDITNIIRFDGHAVITGQLVFPGAVSISIEDPLQIRCRYSVLRIGIGVTFPIQDITAEVILERPGRTIAAALGIIWIVYTDQLADCVINICVRLCSGAYGGKVIIVIICQLMHPTIDMINDVYNYFD